MLVRIAQQSKGVRITSRTGDACTCYTEYTTCACVCVGHWNTARGILSCSEAARDRLESKANEIKRRLRELPLSRESNLRLVCSRVSTQRSPDSITHTTNVLQTGPAATRHAVEYAAASHIRASRSRIMRQSIINMTRAERHARAASQPASR